MKKRKILFISGTRADYGKIKSILKILERSNDFSPYIYVCGMHLLKRYGSTYNEILKDKYRNVHIANPNSVTQSMSHNIGELIKELTAYVREKDFDMIVVHGDRIDALGGAIVGSLNNIRVAHIEGGELSGTIDDSLRHAISKLSHFHFVRSEEARARLIKMGEQKDRIFVIGSPDIDIMLSNALPTIKNVKKRYEISFDRYAILMFHPVTTENNKIGQYASFIVKAVIKSNKNYVVIYPNNDSGSNKILNAYRVLRKNPHFRIFPSIRFEYFLTLLKHADFVIGNSSAAISETKVYGVPSIDIGTRQSNRYSINNRKDIIHVDYHQSDIVKAIGEISKLKSKLLPNYKQERSSQKFYEIVSKPKFWKIALQKKFVDRD